MLYRLALLALLAGPAAAQTAAPVTIPGATLRAYADSAVSWRDYDGRTRSARVRVRANGARDAERYPFTVVVEDRAANPRPITGDAAFVAETVGRALSVDPTRLAFVFRFTAASFTPDARAGGKALHLRATFRRSSSGALTPSWRALAPDQTEDYTDRAYR